jgi:hypothetical protein
MRAASAPVKTPLPNVLDSGARSVTSREDLTGHTAERMPETPCYTGLATGHRPSGVSSGCSRYTSCANRRWGGLATPAALRRISRVTENDGDDMRSEVNLLAVRAPRRWPLFRVTSIREGRERRVW